MAKRVRHQIAASHSYSEKVSNHFKVRTANNSHYNSLLFSYIFAFIFQHSPSVTKQRSKEKGYTH